MRCGLVVSCLGVAVASASPPRELARERTPILDGRLTLRLVDGMVDGQLVWGDARFELAVDELHGVRDGELQHRLAANVAPVERVRIGGSWTGYVVQPRAPRRNRDGRAQLVVAYVADARGTVGVLAFAISDAGLDDAAAWAALARKSIATLAPAIEPIPPPPPPTADSAVPARIGDARRYCVIEDNALDVRPVTASGPHEIVGGTVRGREVYWWQWRDRAGAHAELITGAARWGTLHVVCHAPDAKQLAAIRRLTEARLTP